MMIRRVVGLALLFVIAAGSRAAAQSTNARFAVHGTVFDSVAGAPLAGAAVHVALRTGAGTPRTVITDAKGAYRVDSLTPGEYVVGFYHDALTALGLDAPTRAFAVATTDAVADLAIPGSATIREVRCGARSAYAAGMLVGSVRDAQTYAAIAGAKVTVEWRAFALDSANYRVVSELRPGVIEGDGLFLVCGLPLDVALDVMFSAPGHRTLSGTVLSVPTTGIGRLDVLLVDSALANGSAVIRGRVTRENGKAVVSGRVTLAALARETTVRDGEFAFASVPSGSWVVRSAVIGVEPRDVMVTAADSAVAVASIVVSNASQRLDAVTVIGKRDRNLDVLDDVLRRSRTGMGTVFLPGHPALRAAVRPGDIMKEARGFTFIRADSVLGRKRCQTVTVYVDDMQLPDGFERVDAFVDIKQVLAVEAWSDITWAPLRYRYGLGFVGAKNIRLRPCAVVAFWTRRSF